MSAARCDMAIYIARVDQAVLGWKRRCHPTVADGLLLYVVKGGTRWFIVHVVCTIYRLVMCSLFRVSVCFASDENRDVAIMYRWTSDVYKVVMDVLLAIAYMGVVAVTRVGERTVSSNVIVLLGGGYALYRLAEVFLLSALLSLDRSYEIRMSSRAIVNTLWHYLEITSSFAVLYGALVYYDPGAIVGSKSGALMASYCGPAYFSTVTMFTLGYGDFTPAPNSTVAMIMVCAELVCGAFMVLVVLQRSVTIAIAGKADVSESLDMNTAASPAHKAMQ